LEIEMNDELIKSGPAAKMMGVSQTTLRTWAERGIVPVAGKGTGTIRQHWLYAAADLEQFKARLEQFKGMRWQ
jgi:DNA-binding transcriptional MerR regulator